ncbi:MAG: hypothetical protein OK422_02140 [Thaumarchaeota archaeon]|nr:hypothetical protein [Nitrososphaerota archaeon]
MTIGLIAIVSFPIPHVFAAKSVAFYLTGTRGSWSCPYLLSLNETILPFYSGAPGFAWCTTYSGNTMPITSVVLIVNVTQYDFYSPLVILSDCSTSTTCTSQVTLASFSTSLRNHLPGTGQADCSPSNMNTIILALEGTPNLMSGDVISLQLSSRSEMPITFCGAELVISGPSDAPTAVPEFGTSGAAVVAIPILVLAMVKLRRLRKGSEIFGPQLQKG